LKKKGLVGDKVREQVGVPKWIFENQQYITAFLRGFFDTDGSVYRLRHGIQVSFSNKSIPLLFSLQSMLRTLGYSPSAVSAFRVYLTRVSDVRRFFREVKPSNAKHQRRFREFIKRVGTQAVNGDAL
jgi:intein/homing endonuclease